MLLSARKVGWVVPLLCGVIASTAGRAGGQDAASTVGIASERGTVEQFAAALVGVNKAVGVILLAEDVRAHQRSLTDNATAARDVSLAVRAFELHHQAYHAEATPSGGLVIVPRAPSWCTRVAQSRHSVVTSGQAFEVLYRLYRIWSSDTTPEIPPGMIGSSDLYRTVIALNTAEASLQDTLNAVVEQVPGLGWALRERYVALKQADGQVTQTPACELALFDSSSWLNTSWTLLAPSMR
jgi:hypothetical protein